MTTTEPKKKTSWREQYEIDLALVRKARDKIIRAQNRGTLSPGLRIVANPTQIVLESVTEDDLAWVKKHFGGREEIQYHGVVKRKERVPVGGGAYYERGRPKAFDTYRLYADLREPDAKHGNPRIEVWGLLRPHECVQWQGHAKFDTLNRPVVSWACAAHNCRKPVSKTKARALGLLPEAKR